MSRARRLRAHRSDASLRRRARRVWLQGLWLEDRTAPAVYDVTTVADVVNAGDGVLSLRESVLAANASVGVADTINLPAGTYTLSLTGAGEDGAATGDLDLRDDVSIQGAGAATTILDGNLADRVFDIFSGTVTVTNLTLRNGRVLSSFEGITEAQGGGIRSRGSVALIGITVTDNQAVGADATATAAARPGYGGGVYQVSGNLGLTDATVSNNQAQGGGVTAATTPGATAGAAGGGGVYVAAGVLTVN